MKKNLVGKQTHHAFFSKKNDASVWSIIFCWGRFSQKLRFLKGSVATFVALPAELRKKQILSLASREKLNRKAR